METSLKSRSALFIMSENAAYLRGNHMQPCGYILNEVVFPFHELRQAGFKIDFATANGKPAPLRIDESEPGGDNTTAAFIEEYVEGSHLRPEVVTPLTDLSPLDYDIVYVPGGVGALYDFGLDGSKVSEFLVKAYDAGKVIGTLGFGGAALLPARLASGKYLVTGKRLTCISDDEERALGLDGVVPFLLAKRMRDIGALTVLTRQFESLVISCGNLVTGQNSASSKDMGKALIDAITNVHRT